LDFTDEMELTQWEGAFSLLNVLVGVRRNLKNDSKPFLEFQENGMFSLVLQESSLIEFCPYKRVRIIDYWETKWYIDPNPDNIDMFWNI
jgi:hypothetical protein